MRFIDRRDGGQQLAAMLGRYRGSSPLVLALPRGGVPVGYEVAMELGAPLDVWCVRKVGAPGFPEFGLGAVAEGGVVYLDRENLERVGASEDEVEAIVAQKRAEVAERAARFHRGGIAPRVEGRTVIVVDDGIATGGTVRAAIQSLRVAGAARVVLAVPVAAMESLAELDELADEIVCVRPTRELYAIGAWYLDFRQVTDEEVLRILERARRRPGSERGEVAVEEEAAP